MSERDKQCDNLAEGFRIFAAYGRNQVVVGADTILAGPCPTETKPEDVARLQEHGWQKDDMDCWSFGVY